MTTVKNAKEDVQVSVGKDQSTVTFGGNKVEVSSDGQTVTAYTSDGVETKPASSGEAAVKGTQINVSEDFNAVVLSGVTIELAEDGHLVISTSGTVITKPAPANDATTLAKKELEVGDVMPDKTIFAGISPDTGKNMFVPLQDASGTLKWKAAMKYAADLDAHGHKDWALPTKGELNVLFANRAAIAKAGGGFNEGGSGRAGWYWSSTQNSNNRGHAWVQGFSGGTQGWDFKDIGVSVRPVRAELRP